MIKKKNNITLLNKKIKKSSKKIKISNYIKFINKKLSKKILTGSINKIFFKIKNFFLFTSNKFNNKKIIYQSSLFLLAKVLKNLYPIIKLEENKIVNDNYYYNINLNKKENINIKLIEKKITELFKKKHVYEKIKINKNECLRYFIKKKENYKIKILKNIKRLKITICKQNNFLDLYGGPYIINTNIIKIIKINNIINNYLIENKNKKKLIRLSGTSFQDKKNLEIDIKLNKKIKKKDHRIIGKELELFTFSNKIGIGMPLWLPKGSILKSKLINFLNEIQIKSGYRPVKTPHIGQKTLYKISGHYDKYGKDSFQPIQTPKKNEEYILKPMNCPHHCEIYNNKTRSYKDLPIRFSEFGDVYRYEKHGELYGLTRTRMFTQDDAHIFCRIDQIKQEFKKVIDLILYVFNKLELKNYIAQISLRNLNDPYKYIGNNKLWDKAEKDIQEAVNEKKIKTIKLTGEAAFYGPKLDFMVKDVAGKTWQLGTIQIDYQMPIRFKLYYIGKNNKKYIPIIIHRAPFGSLERFIAILIEHTNGRFPLWLSPEQVIILPISNKYYNYTNKIFNFLLKQKILVNIDSRNKKIEKKIRDAEMKKIPYMIIVGEKEKKEEKISIRKRGKINKGLMNLKTFINLFNSEL